MEKEKSKKVDLEIRKAPEELTEQDLEKVTGGEDEFCLEEYCYTKNQSSCKTD